MSNYSSSEKKPSPEQPSDSEQHALTVRNKSVPQTALNIASKSARNVKVWIREEKYSTYLDKAVDWADSAADFMCKKEGNDNRDEVMQMARSPIVFGMWVAIIFFGFFGLWAAFAPLDSAAIARGTVVVDSSKKTIQHLEGGIIEDILVKDGDVVEAGQPLVRLSPTAAKARQDTLVTQLRAAQALEARLIAERDGQNSISFPEELLQHQSNPEVKKLMDTQQKLFTVRRNDVEGKIKVLQQRIAQLQDQIQGVTAQANAAKAQMGYIRDEIAVVKKLLEQGDANRPRLLLLERTEAQLRGSQGQYLAEAAKAKQTITEAELEILNTKNTRLNEVVRDLRDTQVGVADLQEKVRASTDVAQRLVITAPVAGMVNGLAYHTVGGVIPPGGPIMDIVPQNDKLVIDAQVSPQDIDIVHVGLKARVRLTAFKARTTPILEGKVVKLSADRFVDKASGASYYVARVEIEKKALDKLTKIKHADLYPGMPADVLIVVGTRTFLHYLFSPITDTFNHAFREV